MSCDLTQGRLLSCKDAIGGVKEILWCVASNVEFDALVGGEVNDILSNTTFYRWEINRNSGVFDQTVTASMENGTVFFSQALAFNMNKIEALVNEELHNAMKNRLVIIVHDNNDNWHVMGFRYGAEVSGGGVKTGTAKGDLNGYENNWTAEEREPAPLLAFALNDATAIGLLTGTVVIDPAY